jgi:hypothetical protein
MAIKLRFLPERKKLFPSILSIGLQMSKKDSSEESGKNEIKIVYRKQNQGFC